MTFCGTIHCEVVSSSISARTSDTSPSGKLLLRVAPEDLGKLLGYLEKLGKIAEHSTEREDKTTEVVDTDARIKNLTAFRDNLRAMLVKQSARVSDLVEIQKQLTDTQSELDSHVAQRKILANETEKVLVQVAFRVERPASSRGGFSLIWGAVRESGDVLADSTASLISTVVAIVPWLIVLIPIVWLLRKGWVRIRSRRKLNAPAHTPPPTQL